MNVLCLVAVLVPAGGGAIATAGHSEADQRVLAVAVTRIDVARQARLARTALLAGPAPLAGSARLAEQPTARWQWPLDPTPAVVHRFQIGPAAWSPGHRGADLSAVAGQSIRAPAAGVVRFAGVVAGRPVMTIDHGNGLVTSLEPVSTTLSPGTQVSAGQVIGTLSRLPGHCAPQSCLHWGVRRHGRYIDPLELVGWKPPVIILLPMLCCP